MMAKGDKDMDWKYYLVYAKCGHVKRSQYVVKCFPVRAANGKEAAKIVRNKPRVKHHDKHAIVDIKEVSKEEYLNQIKINNDDNFYTVHSVQEQRAMCPDVYLDAQKEIEIETYKKTSLRRQLVDKQKAKEMEKSKRYYDYE